MLPEETMKNPVRIVPQEVDKALPPQEARGLFRDPGDLRHVADGFKRCLLGKSLRLAIPSSFGFFPRRVSVPQF